jgi:hypothetical protein
MKSRIKKKLELEKKERKMVPKRLNLGIINRVLVVFKRLLDGAVIENV